jgi:glycosyltransferase involved in cell wall biosynthesis
MVQLSAVTTAYPTVSIVTPTYNRADYLVETIESVLGQTYPNIEYIVLDDGSKDNTQDILKRYEGRLLWEHHPNMGETRTVNKGWSMTHGEYIMIVNSDDPIMPDTVEKMVAYLDANRTLLAAYPDWNVIDGKSQVLRPADAWVYSLHEMIRCCACFPGPGTLMRRKALKLEPARDLRYRYVADLEYWWRLGLHGDFARVPEILATHRTHPDSAGVRLNKQVVEELIRFTHEFFARPSLPSDVRALYRESLASAHYYAGRESINSDYWYAARHLIHALLLHPRLRFTHKLKPSAQRIFYYLIYKPIQTTPLRPLLYPLKAIRSFWHAIRWQRKAP